MQRKFYILFCFIYKGDKNFKRLGFSAFILVRLKNKQCYIVLL